MSGTRSVTSACKYGTGATPVADVGGGLVTVPGKLIFTSFDCVSATNPAPLYPFSAAYMQGEGEGVDDEAQSKAVPAVNPEPGVGVPSAFTKTSMMPAWQAASAAPWAVWRWNHIFVMSTAKPMRPSRNIPIANITNIVTWPLSLVCLMSLVLFIS